MYFSSFDKISYSIKFQWFLIPCFLVIYDLNIAQEIYSSNADSTTIFERRQNLIKYGGAATYGLASYWLYNNWYKNFEQSGFHFFDDYGQWENVDKLGHMQASYMQTDLIHHSLIWAGWSEEKTLLSSAFISLGFQTTVEIMDGFSEEWGFSWSDFVSNILGAGSYVLQEKLWHQQKIKFKVSYWPKSYSNTGMNSSNGSQLFSLKERADFLFGNHFFEQSLKDYNAQTIWITSNPNQWIKTSIWPGWLGVAVGYSADNMYGGFNNSWEHKGEYVNVNQELYPRYRQYILAFDYDLTHLKVKGKFMKTLFKLLDIFKWPSPAIELRSNGELHFHLLFLN